MVVGVGNVGFLKKSTQSRLELPMCRLQQLLRLIRRTARSQHELVDHDLMPELLHIHRHGEGNETTTRKRRASSTHCVCLGLKEGEGKKKNPQRILFVVVSSFFASFIGRSAPSPPLQGCVCCYPPHQPLVGSPVKSTPQTTASRGGACGVGEGGSQRCLNVLFHARRGR